MYKLILKCYNCNIVSSKKQLLNINLCLLYYGKY